MFVYRTRKANANASVNPNETNECEISIENLLHFCFASIQMTLSTSQMIMPSLSLFLFSLFLARFQSFSYVPFVCHHLLIMSLWNFALTHTKNLERYKLKWNWWAWNDNKNIIIITNNNTTNKMRWAFIPLTHDHLSISQAHNIRLLMYSLTHHRNKMVRQQQANRVLRNHLPLYVIHCVCMRTRLNSAVQFWRCQSLTSVLNYNLHRL